MIYKDGKKLIPFKGNYKPVNIYKGETKVAGWEYSEVSGESLAVENTYNDSVGIRIYGKTIEVGEGDKSPDNLYVLESVSDFDLVSCGRNLFDVEHPDIIGKYYFTSSLVTNADVDTYVVKCIPNKNYVISNFPQNGVSITNITYWNGNTYLGKTSIDYPAYTFKTPVNCNNIRFFVWKNAGDYSRSQLELDSTATPYQPYKGNAIHFPYQLRSLPNGTKDYIEIDNINKIAKLYRNIGEKVFDGTESFSLYSDNQPDYCTFVYYTSLGVRGVICTHFPYYDYDYATANVINSISVNSSKTGCYFKVLGIFTTTDFKTWLTSQYNTGVPVKVQYQLATPAITDLDYNAVKTYYPYTNIYTNATIQPTLDGKFRIIGG